MKIPDTPKTLIYTLLMLAALCCPAPASDAVAEREIADVLAPSGFFTAKTLDGSIAFGNPRTTHIQGVKLDVPVPEGCQITEKTLPDPDGDPINFFYFEKDGTMLLECAFRRRRLIGADGEPFRGDKLATAKDWNQNLELRERAENVGDKNTLASLPVITLIQNTERSILLEARLPDYDPAAAKGIYAALFEGHVKLANSSIMVAAQAHKNQQGIDTASLYVTWLNKILETYKR